MATPEIELEFWNGLWFGKKCFDLAQIWQRDILMYKEQNETPGFARSPGAPSARRAIAVVFDLQRGKLVAGLTNSDYNAIVCLQITSDVLD